MSITDCLIQAGTMYKVTVEADTKQVDYRYTYLWQFDILHLSWN